MKKIDPAILRHLGRDPKLQGIIQPVLDKYDQSQQGVFIDLIRSIIGQQVSTASARSVYAKLTALMQTDHFLPEELLEKEEEELLSCGISRQKRGYLYNVANFFHQNPNIENRLHKMTDEEVIKALTQIKGVGVWTAQMILMFSLGRPDVFPTNDVGIQNAMKKIYGIASEKKDLIRELEQLSEPWRPYRTQACIFLWNSLH